MVESIEELRKICQRKDPRYPRGYRATKIPVRKISIYFTKLFLYTSITANQVTLINILIGIIGCVFLAFGPSWYRIVGALVLHLWFILDHVDGEIARYRGNTSISGLYLDRLNGIIVSPWIFICLTLRVFNILHDANVFIFGILASISTLQMQLVAFNLYVSVLDVYSQSRGDNVLSKEHSTASEGVGIDAFRSDLESRSPIIYNIVDLMQPGGMGFLWIIIAAGIMDTAIPPSVIGSFTFDSTYLIIILYGVLMPLGWLVLAYVILRNKLPEKSYLTFIKSKKEDQCKD